MALLEESLLFTHLQTGMAGEVPNAHAEQEDQQHGQQPHVGGLERERHLLGRRRMERGHDTQNGAPAGT